MLLTVLQYTDDAALNAHLKSSVLLDAVAMASTCFHLADWSKPITL